MTREDFDRLCIQNGWSVYNFLHPNDVVIRNSDGSIVITKGDIERNYEKRRLQLLGVDCPCSDNDRISKLTSENMRMKEALEKIAVGHCDVRDGSTPSEVAKSALEGKATTLT